MHSPLQAAIEYAALGYTVLPIVPSGKHPITALAPRGAYSANDNPHVLRAWFSAVPDANLAIVPPAGCAVLDFDEAEQFSRFLRRWRGLSQAPHSLTPRGGAHLYLRVPADSPLRSRSGKGLPDFEVKSYKNYLLEAPSHTERGTYQWIAPLRAPGELPEIPRDLLAALQVPVAAPVTSTPSQRALLAALDLEVHRVRTAAVGGRHNQLVRSSARVGGLVAQGLARERGYTALLEAARSVGLPDAEIVAAICWGLERGKENPAPVRELPPRLRLWLNRRKRLGVDHER